MINKTQQCYTMSSNEINSLDKE